MDPWLSLPKIVIDRSQLQEFSEGDQAIEQELLHLFVEDTQEHLTRLHLAIAHQAFEEARREAHHIKGASAHVAALTMFAIAAELEDQLQQQPSPLPLTLLKHLETAYQNVIDQIEQWDQESATLG